MWLVKLFKKTSNKKIRTLGVLNGVIGDALGKKKNLLAIQMGFYKEFKLLALTKKTLSKIHGTHSGKICILAHGSCGTEQDWVFVHNSSINYGSLLQFDKGYAPFFVRYNSGLHISTNGKLLSDLLEKLVRCYPTKIDHIILIGHSMGGLVFRSACHYGKIKKCKWVTLVKKIFYLGSPHLGTHLEKLGNLTTSILKQIPNPITKIIATIGNWRSAGIKDLRHGYVTDEDWQKHNTDNLFHIHKNKTPLLASADHYMICSTISKNADSKMGRLFGDGLVHPASGTGRGFFESNRIHFSKDHTKIFAGISHHKLQRNQRVYEQIKSWLEID